MLSQVRRIINAFKQIDFKSTLSHISKSDVLLFCHDVDRGVTLNDQAYAQLLDSVRDELVAKGYSCVTIAHPWSVLGGEKAYGNPLLMNRDYLVAKLLTKLKIDKTREVKLYKRIIGQVSPKVIITIGCNDALCEAARVLQVYHVELLHGIGYTPMPWGWDKKNKEQLPQGILSLDDVSTKTFKELEKYKIKVLQIPHPFLRRFIGNERSKLPIDWQLQSIVNSNRKEILVSFSWGYAPDIDELDCFKGILKNGLFFEELEDVVKQTADSVYWRFRFHPLQYRQKRKYARLFTFMDNFVTKHPNSEWVESTFKPLPSVLAGCSGHITMTSMVCYEAAYFGVKSLALCPSLQAGGIYENFLMDLVDIGYVKKCNPNINEIISWVTVTQKTRPLLNNIDERIPENNLVSFLLREY
ncbi:MAG: hypothetical protein LDLANPLL_01642 [Turneriella sp.]|nr:hypothetical protein [Turneriella sp.]